MRLLDAHVPESLGVPSRILMENAGAALAGQAKVMLSDVAGKRINIWCGTGNNGGDGFVAARHLAGMGALVSVTLVGSQDALKGDARLNFDAMTLCGIVPGPAHGAPALQIDAVLGTGLRLPLRAPAAAALREMMCAQAPVLCADIPSGLDSDTGQAASECVRATVTCTFGYPKLGFLIGEGPDHTGLLAVEPIGIDWDRLECPDHRWWIRPDWVASLISRRARQTHKGDLGHVLVVGGSVGMSGAPGLSALAALRTGAGLVTVAVPASIRQEVAARTPEVMALGLADHKGCLFSDGLARALDAASRANAACIGPGAGQSDITARLLLDLYQQLPVPCTVDADGLNALSGVRHRCRPIGPRVLTPHPGEAARLLGVTTSEVQTDRLGAAEKIADKYGAVVVLKGASTVVANPTKPRTAPRRPAAINTTGNPGMATAGSGDVLAGMLAALLARGLPSYEAACAAVYLHGAAGDIAAKRVGHEGLIASDIIHAVPAALAALEEYR